MTLPNRGERVVKEYEITYEGFYGVDLGKVARVNGVINGEMK
jgi:hypothetical protein